MKRMFVMMALLIPLTWAGVSAAADANAGAKPDCSAKQKSYDEAKTDAKPQKADLTSCKDKKGKEKTDCEKPLKDAAKEATKAAQDKVKSAKTDLACCKNPKAKGCPS